MILTARKDLLEGKKNLELFVSCEALWGQASHCCHLWCGVGRWEQLSSVRVWVSRWPPSCFWWAQVPWCPSTAPPLKLFAHVIEAQNCQNLCGLTKAHPVYVPVHLELPVQLDWAVFVTVSVFVTFLYFWQSCVCDNSVFLTVLYFWQSCISDSSVFPTTPVFLTVLCFWLGLLTNATCCLAFPCHEGHGDPG